MNHKTKELINLIFKRLKNYKDSNLKITRKEVEEFVSYLIYNN